MPPPSTATCSRPTSPPRSATLCAGPRPEGGTTAQASRGIFVTIEGPDFSGKSTLVHAIKPLLAEAEPPTYFTREPGGTPAAERIRRLVLDPEVEMDAWADHARRGILPRLVRGENVVCERYLDSSLAYQGYGRELGVEAVRELNSWAVETVVPDRAFYLRLGAEERARRALRLGEPLDRIEKVGDEFMRRVEEGFEELVRREANRIEVLDGERSPEELAELVVGEIRSLQYTRRGDD